MNLPSSKTRQPSNPSITGASVSQTSSFGPLLVFRFSIRKMRVPSLYLRIFTEPVVSCSCVMNFPSARTSEDSTSSVESVALLLLESGCSFSAPVSSVFSWVCFFRGHCSFRKLRKSFFNSCVSKQFPRLKVCSRCNNKRH